MTDKEELSRGDALAKVAALEAELVKTQQREADTDKQLHALRKSIASTSTSVGDERHQDALGEWETVLERINERYEFRAAPAPVERVEQEQKVFWVLFDNTGGEKFIKQCADTGALAIFDSEGDALRAKCINTGTDYKRVEYYTTPQPAPTAAQDVAGLVEALRTVVGALHHKATTPLERESIRIAEAALAAQQGKEGET